jgi:hypothetical protein
VEQQVRQMNGGGTAEQCRRTTSYHAQKRTVQDVTLVILNALVISSTAPI